MKGIAVLVVLSALAALLLLDWATRDQPQLDLVLNQQELEWVGEQVFRNECAGRRECLVHWNEGEAFPSLGIGHFIWYPEGVDGRFVESFPALVSFLQSRSAMVPEWLTSLDPFAAPWPDRAAFLAVEDNAQVESLRQFLAATKGLQAEFIVRRAHQSLGRVIEAAPEAERPQVRNRLEALTATPGGTYALIDYVNFKGEGLSPRETYQGQGWGLLQVLLAMEPQEQTPAVTQFRKAAGRVLTRRAHNAANPIERERWLPGWLKRLETYREP